MFSGGAPPGGYLQRIFFPFLNSAFMSLVLIPASKDVLKEYSSKLGYEIGRSGAFLYEMVRATGLLC